MPDDTKYKVPVNFRKIGNSLTVTIPADIVQRMGLIKDQGAVLETGEYDDRLGILIVPIGNGDQGPGSASGREGGSND